MICIRVRAEQFNEETLHRSCRAGVSLGMIGGPCGWGSSLMGKTMHCTAVNNELPVSTSAVHFFNKRAHPRHWDMRIQSTVADKYLCLDQPRLSWLGRVQAPVHANYSCQLHAASRQFEHGHPSEAVADPCDAPIDSWLRGQHFYSRARPLAQSRAVTPQFHNAGHDALTIACNAIAVHVASKYDETELSQPPRSPFRVVVEASAPMDNQNAGTLMIPRIIPS